MNSRASDGWAHTTCHLNAPGTRHIVTITSAIVSRIRLIPEPQTGASFGGTDAFESKLVNR